VQLLSTWRLDVRLVLVAGVDQLVFAVSPAALVAGRDQQHVLHVHHEFDTRFRKPVLDPRSRPMSSFMISPEWRG